MKPRLACLFLSGAALAAQAAGSYSVYENTRFDFSVEVPSILEPQGESGNGDGQVFSSRNGDATAVVHGSRDGASCTALGMLADPAASTITYRFAKGAASVVSGYQGGRIFYKKAIQKKDRCLMLDIEYDAGSRKVYDPVIVRMEKSFGSN